MEKTLQRFAVELMELIRFWSVLLHRLFEKLLRIFLEPGTRLALCEARTAIEQVRSTLRLSAESGRLIDET